MKAFILLATAAGVVVAFLALRLWTVLRSRIAGPFRDCLKLLVVAGSGELAGRVGLEDYKSQNALRHSPVIFYAPSGAAARTVVVFPRAWPLADPAGSKCRFGFKTRPWIFFE